MATPVFARVSTTGKVVEYLRRSIESGALNPGDRITEYDIATKLGISRSPVREALATLAQEGVVTIIPYRGAIVSTVDSERFAALLKFRLVLEEFALREFIANATELDYARIASEVAKIRKRAQTGNVSATLEADLHLHQIIVSCVKNPFLERTYAELLGHFQLYATLTTTAVYENLEDLADEHDHWIEAVRRGDTAGALAVMHAHIELGFAEALEQLRAAEAGARAAAPPRRRRSSKR
jgi:DNA-binding GntR family transcriptional regulator